MINEMNRRKRKLMVSEIYFASLINAQKRMGESFWLFRFVVKHAENHSFHHNG